METVTPNIYTNSVPLDMEKIYSNSYPLFTLFHLSQMVQDFFRNSIRRMPVLILSLGAVMNKNPAVVPFVLSRTTSCFEEYLNPNHYHPRQ